MQRNRVSGLPGYIYQPASSIITPPVVTKLQNLPFDQLEWKNFERLCARLITESSEVAYSYLYGIPGQPQYGIDIFAKRHGKQKYSVYQCKKVQEFSSSEMKAAIKKFVDEKWKDTSDELYICLACDYLRTEQLELFESEKAILSTQGISLVKWDASELSHFLRNRPDIVDDFFGREWVKFFCGEDICDSLSQKSKLSVTEQVKLRQDLNSFYTNVFNRSDITQISMQSKLDFTSKYILPEVYFDEELVIETPGEQGKGQNAGFERLKNIRDIPYPMDMQEAEAFFALRTFQKGKNSHQISFENRALIDQKVSGTDRSILVGEAGLGKSSFLKYLTIDLLSDNPILVSCVKKWGTLLPLWMPFAFITKQIATDLNISLQQIFEIWFHSHDENKFGKLITAAFGKRHIILIIDGLDEWTDEGAARQALRRIGILADAGNLPVIYSSRRYGLKVLENDLQGYTRHYLAPFSMSQQTEFLTNLFSGLFTEQQIDEVEQNKKGAKKATDFVEELNSSNDIADLARNPLMLSVLAGQKIRNAIIPRNKFQAFQEIIKYLIEQHPQKRKIDANLAEGIHPELSEYLHKIYALVAHHMQVKSPEGILNKKEAAQVIQYFLEDELGFQKEKSTRESRSFISFSESFIGVLAEKSPNEISFIHRQFQEFLCAQYFSEQPLSAIKDILINQAHSAKWQQVIFYIFHFTTRPVEFKELLKILENQVDIHRGNLQLRLLYFKVALEITTCPLAECTRVLTVAFEKFAISTNHDFKAELLEILLSAVHNPKIRQTILEWVGQWVPYKFSYTDPRVKYTEELHACGVDVFPYLLTVFCNGEIYDQLSVCGILGRLIKENPSKYAGFFIDTCFEGNTDIIRGLAINVLTLSLDKENIQPLLEKIDNKSVADAPIIQFFLIKAKVYLLYQTDSDLNKLLELERLLPYAFTDEIVELLITGWKNNESLFIICQDFLKERQALRISIFNRQFWQIYIGCFYMRSEIIQSITQHIENETYLFSFNNGKEWAALLTCIPDCPDITMVMEKRFFTNPQRDNDVIALSYAADYCHSDYAKTHLLTNMRLYHFSPWIIHALIRNWENDQDVKHAFQLLLENDKDSVHVIGISHLFCDKKAWLKELLESKIFDTSFNRRSDVLKALILLDRDYFESHLLDRFIEMLPTFDVKSFFNPYYHVFGTLATYFPANPRLKKIVREKIDMSADISYSVELAFRLLSDDKRLMATLLTQSLPLEDRLKVKMVEKFFSKERLSNDKLLEVMHAETSPNISSLIAINLYEHCKNSPQDIKEIGLDLRSNTIITQENFDGNLNKQNAFAGWLIFDQLQTLSELLKGRPDTSFRIEMYSDKINLPFLRLLLQHYGKIQAVTGVAGIVEDFKIKPAFWPFASALVEKYDEAFEPLVAYFHGYPNKIEHASFLRFSAKYFPGLAITKTVALSFLHSRILSEQLLAIDILMDQFSNDIEIASMTNNVESNEMSNGMIVFLCKAFPNHDLLEAIFEKTNHDRSSYSRTVTQYVRSLKVNRGRILKYINKIFSNFFQLADQQIGIIDSLLNRISKDELLRDDLLEMLIRQTPGVAQKIFLFKSLSKYAAKDGYALDTWRKAEILFETEAICKSMGYDVLAGKTVSYLDVLEHN